MGTSAVSLTRGPADDNPIPGLLRGGAFLVGKRTLYLKIHLIALTALRGLILEPMVEHVT